MVRTPGKLMHAETVWALIVDYRLGVMPWLAARGTEPGTAGCLMPQRFQDAALIGRAGGRIDD